MILKTLQISNFRCFTSLAVDFHEKLTVLIAENGNGKTTILDAAAIALDEIVRYYAGGRSNSASRFVLNRGGLDIQIRRVRTRAHAGLNIERDLIGRPGNSLEI